jgi:hypothetical protein
VFIRSGVDTADEQRWRLLLNALAGVDELVTGMNADNIRAAHVGLFRQQQVCGTVPFGYRPKEVSGMPTRRKRPRCAYEIDPETAAWVRTVFTWFVEDRLPIAAIIQRLNADPAIPLPPKAISGQWTRLAVLTLLANPRYRGDWSYGRKKSVWLPKQDYVRQLPREQPLAEAAFEDLRIVGDELWYRAQQLLAEHERPGGRPPKDGDRRSRPRLLNGLFVCPEHDRPLIVGGRNGSTMHCPACQRLPACQRPLFSRLNRVLATRLTGEALAERVRSDPGLVALVVEACRAEAAAAPADGEARLAALRADREKLTRQVQFILDNPGEAEADRREAEQTLRRLRAERARQAAAIGALEAARARPRAVPTEAEVRQALAELGAILAAAEADGGDALCEAREVVRLLTGGRIELEQQGERSPQCGWLRGRFRPRLVAAVAGRLGVPAGAAAPAEEVVIDYRRTLTAEDQAERVKALYEEGMAVRAIARALGIGRQQAHEARAYWYTSRGLPVPDGRKRPRPRGPKRSEERAEAAKALWDQKVPMQEIARRLGIGRDAVTAAIAHWHTSRGLPVPDGRTRRKELGLGRSDAPAGG